MYEREKDAQLALKRHEVAAEEVRRGLRAAATVRTFQELADNWRTGRMKEKRSGASDESMLAQHLEPSFADLTLAQLTPERVRAAAATWTVKQGPRKGEPLGTTTRHHVLTLLISLLHHAREMGWIERVPKIRKPKLEDGDFTWLRTADEVRAFLRAARDEGDVPFALYATAIHTGMRAGELAGLLWADVDLDARIVTVQRSFAGPTKSGRIRHVPISDELLEVLRAWRLRNPLPIVFPTRLGTAYANSSAHVFQDVFQRTLTAAGITGERRANGRQAMTFHALRHTFASWWVKRGGDLYKLQRVGGWRSFAMVQRYAHLAPDAFEDDRARLAFGLPSEGKVIALS